MNQSINQSINQSTKAGHGVVYQGSFRFESLGFDAPYVQVRYLVPGTLPGYMLCYGIYSTKYASLNHKENRKPDSTDDSFSP